MRIQKGNLESRQFLVQYAEMERVFGAEIPWMSNLADVQYITNPQAFKEEFKQRIGNQLSDTVTPYSLVTSDRKREYLGGLMHFSKSPEEFDDAELSRMQEELSQSEYSYVTCLLIRDVFRGRMYGTELFSKAIHKIAELHPKMWGVVSNPDLIAWYEHFGWEKQNSMDSNKEGLSIMTFEESSLIKRS